MASYVEKVVNKMMKERVKLLDDEIIKFLKPYGLPLDQEAIARAGYELQVDTQSRDTSSIPDHLVTKTHYTIRLVKIVDQKNISITHKARITYTKK